MEAFGLFLPFVVILGVYYLLALISTTLADLVCIVLIAFPVVWCLNELRRAGREAFLPENWLWTFGQLLVIVPALAAVYFFNADRVLLGSVCLLAYSMLASAAYKAFFNSLRMGGDGAGVGGERVRRGTAVVDAATLNASTSKLRRDGDAAPVTIGGVTIPSSLERQHFLISGTTGAGKTQVINGMLRSIRARGDRCVIADPAAGFFAKFGQDGDSLINPFDARSVKWSPFAEIRQDYDCERIAKAIVPDGVGDGAEWHHYAQTLIAQSMLAMHRKGERSIKRLLYWLTSADQKELGGLLDGTPAAALCAKGNDKMLASTRGIISTYLGVFQYLADEGDFSVRDWVNREDERGWLFITYRDDQMGMLRHLVATFLELSIVEGLSLSESDTRALWYIMDEVDSLGKVTSLRGGLTKLRKYGGRMVLGLQTISQLRTTYGRDEAQTLIANTSTKMVLRAGDAETAKAMEQELGEQEIERDTFNESFSQSDNGLSNSSSSSTQVVRQAAVLASEISGLPDLTGYLKVPGDEVALVKVDYVKMPDVLPAYVGATAAASADATPSDEAGDPFNLDTAKA